MMNYGTIKTRTSWKSRGNTIQASNSHTGLYIINYPDGGFATVSSTEELMMQIHPMDKTHHNGATKR